jgi:hypothetical protein
VCFHVTAYIGGPTDHLATNSTRFRLNLFMCYDNEQQIQVTIRIQERTESLPAAFLLLVVPVPLAVETVDSERRSAGIELMSRLKKT